MTNEVKLLPDVGIDFKPAVISIKDKDAIIKRVKEYVKKYDGSIATEKTLAGDKKVLADLRKMSAAFEDKRKAVHKEIDEPYDAFATDIKEITTIIDTAIKPIAKSIDDLDIKIRGERKEKALEVVADLAPQYEIDPDKVEFDEKWCNKLTPGQLKKKIIAVLEMMQKDKLALQVEKDLVTEHATRYEIDPAGWVSQLNNEYHATDVIKAMDSYIEEQKQKEIQLAKQKEAQAAIEKAKAEASQTKVGDTIIDKETGEVVEPKPQLFNVTIQLTGTQADLIHAVQVMNGLKEQGVTSKTVEGLRPLEV